MNVIYYSLDALLILIVVIAILDDNVAFWLKLKFDHLSIEVRKQWLLLKMKHDMWLMKWRMQRVLKKLQQDQELQAIIREHQENEK